MIVEELVARLGFQVKDIDKLKRAQAAFDHLGTGIARFAVRATAAMAAISGASTLATAGLARAVSGIAKARQELVQFATAQGASGGKTSALTAALEQQGVKAKQVQEFISGLIENLQELSEEGGKTAQTLRKAGLTEKDSKGKKRDPADLAFNAFGLIDVLKGDANEARRILKELGAEDNALLSALLKGHKKLKADIIDAQKRGVIPTKKEAEEGVAFAETLVRIAQGFEGLKNAAASPVIEQLLSSMQKLSDYFVSDNGKRLREGITSILWPIARFVSMASELGVGVLEFFFRVLGEGLAGLIKAVTGFDVGPLGAIATALGAIAFVLAPQAALFVGLTWLAGEFARWSNGEYSPVAGVFETIAGAIRKVEAAVQSLLDWWRQLMTEFGKTSIGRVALGLENAQETRAKAVGNITGAENPKEALSAAESALASKRSLLSRLPNVPSERGERDRLGKQISELAQRIEEAKRILSPEASAARLSSSTDAKAAQDNRKYDNIGNDNRQVSVSVTNNVTGLEGIKNSILNSLSSALVKSSNATTSAVTAP